MSESQKQEQIEEMWEDYEGGEDRYHDYWRKAYRCEPMPPEIMRYLRNDPIADYWETAFRERP